MPRITRKLFFGYAFCVSLLLCLGCASNPVANNGGGSGTETVGVLVNPAGTRLSAARVSVIPTGAGIANPDSQPVETTVVTNATGKYTIPRLAPGSYNLQAVSSDSLYTGLIAFTRIDTAFLDLGTDTLHGPGAIRGRALIASPNMTLTLVYIPGTSYMAYTDSSGYFTMSWVPAGRYALYFYHPSYEIAVVLNVTVFSEETTTVQTQTLQYDPSAIPPAPTGLAAVYDTLSATVHLAWSGVPISDLKDYLVERDSAGTGLKAAGGGVPTTASLDTIAFAPGDSLPVTLRYQVAAVDTLNIEGPPSLPAIVVAVPPWFVTTHFSWTSVPLPNDSLSTADSFTVVVSFNNPTRENKVLSWYLGAGNQLVRRSEVNALSGSDTLSYRVATPGLVPVRVAMLDAGGSTWQDSVSIKIWDSTALRPRDTWLACSSLSVSRRFASAAVIGNRIYAVGGCADQFAGSRYIPSALKTVEMYDAATGRWIRKTDLGTARFAFGLAAIGGTLYALGGTSYTQDILTVESYDTAANSWRIVDTMPAVRQGFATCVLNGSIYCFGGFSQDTLGSYISNAIDVYDPVAGTWTARDTMLVPRSYHQVVACGGKVYIIGGLGGSRSQGDAQALASVEIYDPVTGRKTPAASLRQQRLNFSAALINGGIVVAGGFLSQESNLVLGTVEAFDTTSGLWQARQPMPSPCQAAAGCARDNVLYVIGGASQGYPQLGELKTVVEYYP
jgi:hypothetical protein